MKFSAELEQFEGPLDLMLHLIQKNKLDLFDLDLDQLADQYCAFIRKVSSEELENASEYLVEFTILLEYKSKRLLPKKEEEADSEYEEDQKDRLVARLLEYQRFKELSTCLEQKLEERSRKFDRQPASMIDEWSIPRQSDALIHVPLDDLLKAMKRVLQRQAILNPLDTSVEMRELSIEERIEQIKERLVIMKNPSRFEWFLEDINSLHEMIVTFLAILELIHMQVLAFRLENKNENSSRVKDSEISHSDVSNDAKADDQKSEWNDNLPGSKKTETETLKEADEIIWLYRI